MQPYIFKMMTLYLMLTSLAYAGHRTFFENPSSFYPVGSGARALGICAFIGVADDLTALSWNPGGLTGLKKPEVVLVWSSTFRSEKLQFQSNPEASGSNRVNAHHINCFGIGYPFIVADRNMIVAVSYQHLYDLSRDWQFQFYDIDENSDLYVQKHYLQKGYLSAVGLSYCVDIIPQLSVGVTINFWHDGLDDNQWNYTIRDKIDGVDYSIETHVNNYRQEQYSFKGINYNLGFLMHVTPRFNIGGILKTAFSADLDQNVLVHTHEIYPDYPDYNMDDINTYSYHDSLQMPMSYGLGLQYQLSDAFYIAADWYTICWDQFLIEGNDGIAYNPISLISEKASTIKPVHQFRFGMEYLVKNVHQGYAIPIRWGIFYDPSPAETQPDDFYGVTFGTGFVKRKPFIQKNRFDKWFSLDIAYQYRFGDASIPYFENNGLSDTVDDHRIYVSMIYYLQ